MIFSSNYKRENFSNIKLPNNQLVIDPNITDINNFGGKRISMSIINNELICTAAETISSTNKISNRLCYGCTIQANHFYYIGFSIYYLNTNSNIPDQSIVNLAYDDATAPSINSTYQSINFIPQSNQWVRVEGILISTRNISPTSVTDTRNGLWIGLKGDKSSSIGDTYKIKDINIIDLTAIYGSGKEKSLSHFRIEYPSQCYPYIQDPFRILNAKQYDINIPTTATLSNSDPIILVANDIDIAQAYINNYNFTISLIPKSFDYTFSDVQYHDLVSIHTSDNIL